MNIAAQPKLVMHYAPGILAVLKRQPCTPHTHTLHIGCEHTHCDYADCNYITQTYTIIANVTVLQPGEEQWCLKQSWINREKVNT